MRALLILGISLAAASAQADIYECRGSDGSLDFTNVRRPGAQCRRIIESSDGPSPRRAAARVARPPSRPSDPHRYRRYDGFIEEAARLYQLPINFVRAVVKVESDFNPNVVSRVGAMGLMQLMPRTAASMGVVDPFNPRQNILGGTRYLRILANKFGGDLVLTVAAYNAGEGAVTRYRGVPPYDETRRYVRRVLHHYFGFNAGASPTRPR